MPVRTPGKLVTGIRTPGKLVTALRTPGKLVTLTAPPVNSITWSGPCYKLGFQPDIYAPPYNEPLPAHWVTGEMPAYFGQRARGANTHPELNISEAAAFELWLTNASSGDRGGGSGPDLTSEAEQGLIISFEHATAGTLTVEGPNGPNIGSTDTTEPYLWSYPDASTKHTEIDTWYAAVSNGDQLTITITLTPTPPPPPTPVETPAEAATRILADLGVGAAYVLDVTFSDHNNVKWQSGSRGTLNAEYPSGSMADATAFRLFRVRASGNPRNMNTWRGSDGTFNFNTSTFFTAAYDLYIMNVDDRQWIGMDMTDASSLAAESFAFTNSSIADSKRTNLPDADADLTDWLDTLAEKRVLIAITTNLTYNPFP